eukprot:9327541-Pyramimonas_sp.AAC.1
MRQRADEIARGSWIGPVDFLVMSDLLQVQIILGCGQTWASVHKYLMQSDCPESTAAFDALKLPEAPGHRSVHV